MSTEENKAIVRRFVEEAQGRGNYQVIDEVVAPTFINQSAPPGFPADREGVRATFDLFRAAFPDLTVVIHDQIAEGDKVVTRKTFQGTHQGEFMGIPPTGRKVTIGVTDILRVHEARIVEHWGQVDMLGLMQQLGVIPSPGQAG